MNGYMGKLLRVNLTTGKATEEPLDVQQARHYMGGTGLGARLIYNEVPPEADPLGPQNKLAFMTGPLTATRFPTAGRYQLVFKSPLSHTLTASSSGGFWGNELKQAGYDGLIVEGQSARPLYLWITDDGVEFRDASHLWGMDALKVQDAIREELGDPKARVAAIGPAGENRVLISCVTNDVGRNPARGGNGAVMGAKKLKAIAVHGTKRVSLANEESFNALVKKLVGGEWPVIPGSEGLTPYGTALSLDSGWGTGDIPVKNWQVGEWMEGCLKISGERMAETILVRPMGCYRCHIRCGRYVRIEEGPYAMEGAGPEYETLAMLGTNCLIDDLEAVAYANHLCNAYGMDTVSTGSAVAFAMEVFEKGLLTREDTGGIDLTWGKAEAMVQVVELMRQNKGIGALLNQGIRRASAEIGGGSEDFAYQVKGLEAPAHDPRCNFSLAATYATGPRGACHLQGYSHCWDGAEDPFPEWGVTGMTPKYDNKGKGILAKFAQDYAAICNSMVICVYTVLYHPIQPSDLAAFLGPVTGWEYTPRTLLTLGERIGILRRAYNNRVGFSREDDCLPKRALERLDTSASAGQVPDLEYQLEEYYQARGLAPDGRPTREKLLELGLDDVIQDLYG